MGVCACHFSGAAAAQKRTVAPHKLTHTHTRTVVQSVKTQWPAVIAVVACGSA